MLKIENTEFEIKSAEMNIRQRVYEGNNVVTFILNVEFYPEFVNDGIVNGALEAKIDMEGIHALDDLVDKSYEGDIGSVTISVNNNGIWEHQNVDNFKVKFGKRSGRKLEVLLETDNCKLATDVVMVSLYTTSSSEEVLMKNFDLGDFYGVKQVKEIGKSQVIKYFVKK